ESRKTLINNQFSENRAILVVNSDITEKKQLEKQFYHAQRLESLGTLASGIAHDLNNILTPILGASQLLPLKITNINEPTQRLLNILSASAKRGADLVKQILLFGRITDGQSVILQLGYLLLELIGIAQHTFPKSITISTHIPAMELWTISGDPTQIHQVFMNLMINARDAMSSGGTLTISAENSQLNEDDALMNLEAKAGCYVAVTVADTGIGIPPELLNRIFDPFFTTKEVGKGTGLGLSTVMGIVKNHGGFIKVYSELGKGTEFKVFLPAIEGEVSLPPVEEAIRRGKGELILIVDDEASIREITQTSLENYNYRTLLASDGLEALAIYREHQQEISVVLMDMMMPNLDGISAIRALQTINPRVNIIATSGLVANRKLALDANVKTFLLKPYTIAQLLQMLTEILPGDENQTNGIPPLTSTSEESASLPTLELSREALAIMPPEWLQQMYDAAYYCDQDIVLQLIEQIPPSQVAIANALKDLAVSFKTDIIMELTDLSKLGITKDP
ncbi:MAG TPA: ATP-binding protein, partial [Microcoleus sp.]|nr:ATP-binding protein [Microcoleus sp.]